ncbi:MAG: hypothetical protein AseanaTS_29350 [Candidatus Pelagadaptatus aseana]
MKAKASVVDIFISKMSCRKDCYKECGNATRTDRDVALLPFEKPAQGFFHFYPKQFPFYPARLTLSFDAKH